MPTLSIVNFNIVCATLGGFISIFGLVSFLLKEKFYLSEALLATVVGLIFSPHALDWIKPLEFANGNPEDLQTITLYFTRLVLGVQLVLAGVQLPSKYLRTEWRSLAILLGPGLCVMWMCTSLLVWALVPNITILYALAAGACVTPTDPVLSNSIVKGKFADKNIPPKLQKIIIAESGANDGLGYPFLFLALYLLKYTNDHGLGSPGGGGMAIGLWFYETWAYTILLSVAYGAVVGWIAKELLHWAEERRYVDRESFLVFAITLALFIVGTVGMLGSDDVLACFIAGNAFTWDDWFRLETQDDSLQPTIDMLLNVSIFMWFGAVCPWHYFVTNPVIPIYRLIALGITVLLFRRLPMVLAFHTWIHQVEEFRHALFVGFFGPIGVSAIFYLYISLEFLRTIDVDGEEREDAVRAGEIIEVVVWFLAICSIVVHGLSVPLGKLGLYLPRTISEALSVERMSRPSSQIADDQDEPEPWNVRQNATDDSHYLQRLFRSKPASTGRGPSSTGKSGASLFPRTIIRFGRHVMGDLRSNRETAAHDNQSVGSSPVPNLSGGDGHPKISGPTNPRIIGRPVVSPPADSSTAGPATREARGLGSAARSRVASPMPSGATPPSRTQSPGLPWNRSIRFPDEPPSAAPTTGNDHTPLNDGRSGIENPVSESKVAPESG